MATDQEVAGPCKPIPEGGAPLGKASSKGRRFAVVVGVIIRAHSLKRLQAPQGSAPPGLATTAQRHTEEP